ncbi:ATP-binding protein [Nonomuraea purpurea]|uniref:ATP-binding protein n=1 Tax=Nonomuraea purpurea TaxID=1849276 RepID=UPI0036D2E98C
MREHALGALVRAWRERALLTQEQLAERSGLNVRTIRRLEAGELRRPRSTSLKLLVEALGLSPDEQALLTAGGTSQSARPSRTIPRQLPADVAAFVGRTRELAVLDDSGTVVIAAIDGMAGVGKTALAVHAAHQLAPRFPDGALFVDLHGYTQGVAPTGPGDTLARVLDVLGVPGESIPRHPDDRAALYRSVLAGRKMLIVLDNAADEAQVRPLLPGGGGSMALVTSRRRLVGLDEARTVSVDVLPLPDAIALFTATAGEDRVEGVPEETLAEVVRRCGLLPLAIRLAAARLRTHPAWSVPHLLERLPEHLTDAHAGQHSITAALDLSYRELEEEVRRAYRLLGSHPGTDIAPDAAAALFARSVARTDRLLDQLLEVHLLQEPVPGRYRFHDLIRAHAASVEPDADRRAALNRLLDHYSQTASAVMDRLYPYQADMRPRLPSASVPDVADPDAWLDAELANLLALARHAAEGGFPHHVRHLSATLHRCLRTRGRYTDAETLHKRALATATAAADRTAEMEALIGLGEIRRLQGRYEAGTEYITRALDIARATGHRPGELQARNCLGMLGGHSGQYAQALGHQARALAIARTIGHSTGELDALIGSGNLHRIMGDHEQGAANLALALDLARSIGHRTSESVALLGLGHVHVERGEYERAAGCFTQALALAYGAGHRVSELDSLIGLGHLYRIQRRYEQAHDCYRQALDLAREIGNRNWQFEALHRMGRLRFDLGDAGEALDDHRQALAVATDLGQPSDQARAHDGLAHAHAALGHHDDARRHWSEALAVLVSLGTDQTEEGGVDVETIRAHLLRSP